ncbi:NAD(P)H-dependent oxidoreductase [Conyzicola nivalis]|uniref:FMN reductase n=1 Tax=Conyzicola nivalis TaxID=1477021 RepID=A0A916SI59_9MICO|nr:NAD(P)H-dependent oxidoreductase [Conyzicola nivalis]GGA98651.1 FMN reductase [Conyzicola nivalis]
MTFLISGVVGNPRADSKTLAATRSLVASLTDALGASDAGVVDLAEFGGRVLDSSDAGVAGERARLAAVQLLVVATPVYKGSYTGLLKAFLDGYGPGALSSTFAVPLTIAASPQHSLAGGTHLQPVLDELGALSPLGGLFLPDAVAADGAQRDTAIAEWIERRSVVLGSLAGVAA